jgi:DNA-binding transcriptional LysR family regulator
MTGAQRWAALEIRLISAFVAVVEKGSFAAAARELGYTQSGVSQQVAALERIVDCKLLIRHAGGRRPVQPTAAGKALLDHSRALLAQIDRAYEDVNGSMAAPGNTVRVSAFSSIAVHVLPELLKRTEARVELVEHRSDEELHEHLDSGAADVAFAMLPVPPRYAAEELGADSYVAMVPSGSPLAARTQVSVSDLGDVSLLGITRCPHEETVEARLAAAGLARPAFERYDDNKLIQSLVGAEHGVAVVPWLTVDHHDPAVRVLPLALELPPRRIAIVHQRDRLLPPAVREFRTVAIELCRGLLSDAPDLRAKAG